MNVLRRGLVCFLACALFFGIGPQELAQALLNHQNAPPSISLASAAPHDQPPDPATPITAPIPIPSPIPHDQSIEVAELRTEKSKTYLMPNGSYKASLWPEAIHFKDAQGRWQAIDNRLIPSLAQGYLFENRANRFKAHFSGVRAQDMVYFELGSHWLTFAPIGQLRSAAPAVDNNRITFSGLLDGHDVQYEVMANGIKENIILNSPPRQNTLRS